MRRSFFLICCIIISLFLFTSCYPGDADYYETRFDELDINGRVNEAALAIESGKITSRTLGELDTIIEDLSNINTHRNETLNDINGGFISAVKMLNVSAKKRQKDDEGYAAYYDMAKQQFNAANRSLNRYKRTMEGLS